MSFEQLTINLQLIHPQLIPVIQMLVSSIGAALFILLAKLLTRLHSPQIVYYRSLSMLCINTLIIWNQKEETYNFPRSIKYKMITRGIFGGIGASLIFEGLKYMTLSENIVLMRTSPIWTAIIVIFITKQEKFSLTLLITMIFAFIGVLLVARPPQVTPILKYFHLINYEDSAIYNENYLFGVIITLIGSISVSMIQIFTSSLVKQTNNFALIQYNALIQLMVGVMTSYFYGEAYAFIQINAQEFCIIITMGLISFSSQLLYNMSMVKGKLTLMSMIPQTSVIWALLIDIAIMNQEIQFCSLIGSTLIVFSLIFLVFEKTKPTTKKPSIVPSQISY